eukprot:scaffold275921_cov18-Tisochrysis_lutea.AAC.2
MALGIQGFHLNNTELREYTHGLFAAIAKGCASGFFCLVPVLFWQFVSLLEASHMIGSAARLATVPFLTTVLINLSTEQSPV